ncbi:E3 ubiquitin-protein ligase [Acrasis kona]|uniref:E3 ubiquitin-protein ligase n=1 Tax=Acrasis kona TaxID=1008807 RepID=A0AAW2ZI50_9EUKA
MSQNNYSLLDDGISEDTDNEEFDFNLASFSATMNNAEEEKQCSGEIVDEDSFDLGDVANNSDLMLCDKSDDDHEPLNDELDDIVKVRSSKSITKIDEAYFGDAEVWLRGKELSASGKTKHFGNVGKVFATFEKRRDCFQANIHKQIQAGIDGTSGLPAASVVAQSLGGYHDEDYGDVLTYTGQGGDERTPQVLTRYNACLALNREQKVPVRVVRGYQLDSEYAPPQGYRYDGLYWVTQYWEEEQAPGKATVFKFRLVRLKNQGQIPRIKDWKPKDILRISRSRYLNLKEEVKPKAKRKIKSSRVVKPTKTQDVQTRRRKRLKKEVESRKQPTSLILNTQTPHVPEEYISFKEREMNVSSIALDQEKQLLCKNNTFVTEQSSSAVIPYMNLTNHNSVDSFTNIPTIMRTTSRTLQQIIDRCDQAPPSYDPRVNDWLVNIPRVHQLVNARAVMCMMGDERPPFLDHYQEEIYNREKERAKTIIGMLHQETIDTLEERCLINQSRITLCINKIREL